MRLRPHHLLDIITQYGAGIPFQPSDYGHTVHTVAEAVINHPEEGIEFVVGADDICSPCKHLVAGRCDDVLSQLNPPISKQEYNFEHDPQVIQRAQAASERLKSGEGKTLDEVAKELGITLSPGK